MRYCAPDCTVYVSMPALSGCVLGCVSLFTVYLDVCLNVCLTVCMCLFVYLSICLSAEFRATPGAHSDHRDGVSGQQGNGALAELAETRVHHGRSARPRQRGRRRRGCGREEEGDALHRWRHRDAPRGYYQTTHHLTSA